MIEADVVQASWLVGGAHYEHIPTKLFGRVTSITWEIVEFDGMRQRQFIADPDHFRKLSQEETSYYLLAKEAISGAVRDLAAWGKNASKIDVDVAADILAAVLQDQSAALR